LKQGMIQFTLRRKWIALKEVVDRVFYDLQRLSVETQKHASC